MGAASLLALMARHSLLPSRQLSKLASVHIALIHSEPSSHVNHAHLAGDQQLCLAEDLLNQLLGSFDLDLADRLQQLQLRSSGNAHLNWLLDALSSTLYTYSSLQSSLSKAAYSTSGAPLAKHRADEVLHLLDVCTALKQVAADMDRHFDCLQHSLQSVEDALGSNQCLSNGKLRAAAHRLSVCLLREQPHTSVTGKHYRPLAEARTSLLLATKSKELRIVTTPTDRAAAPLNQALDGTLLSSLLVLATAVSRLEPPSPRKLAGTLSRVCKVISKFLGAKSSCTSSWAASLRQLCRDLRTKQVSAAGGSLFQELEGLDLAAAKIHTAFTTSGTHAIEVAVVKQSVESLSKTLREVQLCTSMLRMQVASLFEALVRLRLTLLNC